MAKSKYTTLRNQAGGFAKTGNATDASLSDVQKETLDTLKQLNVEKAKGQKIDEALRDDLIKKLKLYRDELKLRKEARDVVQEQVDGLDEVLSIGEKIKHNISKVQKISSKTADGFAQMGYQAASIASKIEQQAYQTKEGAKAAKDSVKQMESYSSTVTKAMREFKTGKIDADQLTSRIKYAGEEMESFLDTLDLSNAEMRELYNSIKLSSDAAQNLNKSFAEGKQALKDMKKGLTDVVSEAAGGIPGVSGLANAISMIGTVGVVGTIVALGAAFAQLAEYLMDVYGVAGLYSKQTETQKELNLELTKSINGLNRELTEQSFALGQTIALGGQMRANMAKLGVSGQEFANSTKYASNNLGLAGKNAQEVGANISMMAARTGVSSDQLGNIANTFRDIGDLSGKAAADTLGMAESVAKTVGIPVNAMFEDLAESSELFLQNNYGNEKSMIKQVATLRVMGLAAQKVLQAGQKMVLNYKDSIKSEMQLSALLGKQVDLSQVRQKFASGDAAGAAQALQQQLKGIDLNKMNMFQRQALQDATGMDMDTIMKTGKGGKEGKLETEQSKMAGSIVDLGNTLTNALTKTGINIATINKTAADTFFTAKVTEAQANKRADFDKKMLDFFDKALIALAALAGLTLLAGAFGKGPMKFLGNMMKKGGTKVAGAFGRKAATEVAETGVKKFSQKQILRGFAGKEAKDAALKTAGKATATKVATAGVKTAAKTTSTLAKLGKGLLKGGAIGILGTAASMAGDHFGGQREAAGMQEADRGKVNQGKALKAGATALEYGGYGAAIGSVVPVIGTAVGGAIGGVIGGIKGVFDNWFSEDAKKQEALLKEAEAKKKADAEAAKLQKELGEAEKIINGGEEIFRAALMAQLLEVTRLLDILAIEADSDFTGNSQVYLDGKKITSGLYNKASALYAANSQTKP
jgi:hypothetical protein